jgi:hypothetical protein
MRGVSTRCVRECFVCGSTNPCELRLPHRCVVRILRFVKSSRELSAAQLRKLLAVAMRHRSYYLRLWDRCRAHGIGLDDDLARYACEAWNALARYTGALDDLRRSLPQPYRPVADGRAGIPAGGVGGPAGRGAAPCCGPRAGRAAGPDRVAEPTPAAVPPRTASPTKVLHRITQTTQDYTGPRKQSPPPRPLPTKQQQQSVTRRRIELRCQPGRFVRIGTFFTAGGHALASTIRSAPLTDSYKSPPRTAKAESSSPRCRRRSPAALGAAAGGGAEVVAAAAAAAVVHPAGTPDADNAMGEYWQHKDERQRPGGNSKDPKVPPDAGRDVRPAREELKAHKGAIPDSRNRRHRVGNMRCSSATRRRVTFTVVVEPLRGDGPISSARQRQLDRSLSGDRQDSRAVRGPHECVRHAVAPHPQHAHRHAQQQRRGRAERDQSAGEASQGLTSGTVPHSGQRSGVARRS